MSLAFPKPARRDRQAREGYRRAHPHCEIQGCSQPASPVPLVSYDRGGGDTEQNLLSLCWHHWGGPAGLAQLGANEWVARVGASLETATLTRVVRVLGLEEE